MRVIPRPVGPLFWRRSSTSVCDRSGPAKLLRNALTGRPFCNEFFDKCEEIFLYNPFSDLLDLHNTLFRTSF